MLKNHGANLGFKSVPFSSNHLFLNIFLLNFQFLVHVQNVLNNSTSYCCRRNWYYFH